VAPRRGPLAEEKPTVTVSSPNRSGGTAATLAAVIASITIVGTVTGFCYPLLALVLERQGVDARLIGLNSAIQFGSILLVGPLVPRVVRAVGARRSMLLAIALACAVLLLFPTFPNVYAWFPLRFLLGAAIGVLFIVSEAAINRLAEERRRGLVIGIYSAVLAAGFAFGAGLVSAVGTNGHVPFLLCTVLVAAAALPLAFAPGFGRTRGTAADGKDEGAASGVSACLRSAPSVMFAAFVFGFSDGALFTFLPIYGLSLGLAEGGAALLVSILICGSIVLGPPLGLLADRTDRMFLLIVSALASAVAGLAVPLIGSADAALWLALFLWGGGIGGIYLLGLTLIGQRFATHDLAAANTAFIMMYSVGSIAGPAAGGWAAQAFGPAGPLFACASVFALLPVLAVPRLLLRLRAQPRGATRRAGRA
jgi:MFS family permease